MSLSSASRSAVLGLTVALLTTGGPAAAAGQTSAGEPAAVVTDASTSPPLSAAPTPRRTTGTAPSALPRAPSTPQQHATAAISDPTPIRGDRITVTGTGFTPDEKVTASLPSRNRGHLGTAVADAAGRVAILVTVPATLPDGDQEVLLTGTSGERASTGFQLRSLLADLLTRFIRWWPAG
jgi:hypothetical protein